MVLSLIQKKLDDDVIDLAIESFIDSLSYPYLYGSELDYVEDLSGAPFIIKNLTLEYMRMW